MTKLSTIIRKTIHLGDKDGALEIEFYVNGNVALTFEKRLLNILQPLKGWITIKQSSDMWDLIREGIIEYPINVSVNKTVKRCKLKIKEDDKSFVSEETVPGQQEPV